MNHCLRCGTELPDEKTTFCPECLAMMEKEPVPKDARAVIYPRPKEEKRPRRMAPKPEEQLVTLKKRMHRLTLLVMLLLLLSGIFGVRMIFLQHELNSRPVSGQNYTTNTAAPMEHGE